jgi:hypothetical protein
VFVWFLRVKYLRVSCWRVYKRAAIVYIYKMLYGFFPPFIFQIVRTHKQRSWWWWCERDQRSLRIVFLHPGWESDAFRKVLTRSQLSCGRRLYKWLRQPEDMAVGELGKFHSFSFLCGNISNLTIFYYFTFIVETERNKIEPKTLLLSPIGRGGSQTLHTLVWHCLSVRFVHSSNGWAGHNTHKS